MNFKKTLITGSLILGIGVQCWGIDKGCNFKAISDRLSGKTTTSTLIPNVKSYKDNILEPSSTKVHEKLKDNTFDSLAAKSKLLSSNKEGLNYYKILEKAMPMTFEYDTIKDTKVWKRGTKIIKEVPLDYEANYRWNCVDFYDPDTGEYLGAYYVHGTFDPVTEHYKLVKDETGKVYFDEKIETVWDYNKETNIFEYYDDVYRELLLGRAEGIEEYNTDTMKKYIYMPNGEKVITAELQPRILDKHTGYGADEWRGVRIGEIPVHYEMNEEKTRVFFYRDSNNEYFKECGVEIRTVPGTDNVKAYYVVRSDVFLESVEGGEVGSV